MSETNGTLARRGRRPRLPQEGVPWTIKQLGNVLTERRTEDGARRALREYTDSNSGAGDPEAAKVVGQRVAEITRETIAKSEAVIVNSDVQRAKRVVCRVGMVIMGVSMIANTIANVHAASVAAGGAEVVLFFGINIAWTLDICRVILGVVVPYIVRSMGTLIGILLTQKNLPGGRIAALLGSVAALALLGVSIEHVSYAVKLFTYSSQLVAVALAVGIDVCLVSTEVIGVVLNQRGERQ